MRVPHRSSATAFTAALLPALGIAQGKDPDRDGDGLSDFHEVHKYRTDPDARDSDGDGAPDGDWRERREFQYVVRSVVQVMRPVTVESLCDDHQDVRVLDETEDHVELEVIHYPFTTVHETIAPDPDWRRTAARMPEWTKPGATADWTPVMRANLLLELQAAGIDAGRLDDEELVERAAEWLLARAAYHDGFSTFVTAFDAAGKPFVPEDLLPGVHRIAAQKGLSLEQQWAREVSARGMFEHRARGSCSSTAIYLAGCLRALGVPTRIVLCIPLVDASDERELDMVRQRLVHPEVRRTVIAALDGLRASWSSHTFNEVFVGGRWRRLNGDRLGQGIFDRNLFGLCTHVATFADWADARMPETIGKRQAAGGARDVFGGRNPYSTISLRDEFGPHCELPRPEPERARIDAVRWSDDPTLPDDVRRWFAKREIVGLVATVKPQNGHAFEETLARADLALDLRAPDRPPITARLDAQCWWGKGDHALVAVRLPAGERVPLPVGSYAVVPRNERQDGVAWEAEGVRVRVEPKR